MSRNLVERKIHFFNCKLQKLDASDKSFSKHSDPKKVFDEILNLELSEGEYSRLKKESNDDVSFLYDVKSENNNIKGSYARSRRNSLPYLEKEGVLQTLDIPNDSGLAELTHFIYYPDINILGVEFNFFGPRVSSLTNYLKEKSALTTEPINFIELNPVLNEDIDLQLQDIGEVSLMQLELGRNDLAVLSKLDESLHSAFRESANVSDAETVEIVLKKKKYSRTGFKLPFTKTSIKEILSYGSSREKFQKWKVEAMSKEEKTTKNFDLLEDKMIVSKKVIQVGKRGRVVESEDMYLKIEEAFEELKSNFKIDKRGLE